MSPTADTLAPNYDTVNPATQKGEFVIRDFGKKEQPELTATITEADPQRRFEERSPDYWRDQADQLAVASSSVDRGTTPPQEHTIAIPFPEGDITTNEKLAHNEIAVDGPAVVQVREAALRDANPDQRNLAHLS